MELFEIHGRFQHEMSKTGGDGANRIVRGSSWDNDIDNRQGFNQPTPSLKLF